LQPDENPLLNGAVREEEGGGPRRQRGLDLVLRVWTVSVLVSDVWLLDVLGQRGFGFEAEPYAAAAWVTLAANASLLFVTRRSGATVPRGRAGWAPVALGALAFVAACRTRGAAFAAFPIDTIPDMHRVLAVGVSRLLHGEFPYAAVEVPWRTYMVYQPGMLLPYVVPAVVGVDLRWTAVVGSALVPALWLAVLGRRGIGALCLVAPVAAAWFLDPQQVNFGAQFHDSAWWPWIIGGSLAFVEGQWLAAGLLWGAAIASRQYAAGVAALLFLHLVWRVGWRPAVTFALAAGAMTTLLYGPFLAIDWRSVLVQPLRTYHDVMTMYVIPQRPEWIRSSMGWSWWLIDLPGYYAWVLPAQLAIVGLVIVAATCRVRTRAGALVSGGLALLLFNFLQDWPVWYLHIVPLLLVATGALDAATRPSDDG
jgi:hypothetical protein